MFCAKVVPHLVEDGMQRAHANAPRQPLRDNAEGSLRMPPWVIASWVKQEAASEPR